MDKLTLTSEQLKELELYVHKRGFRDAVVKAEILDHFACKVEEVMTEEPQLKFEDAMLKAHRAFGNLGFAPIRENLDKYLKVKYRGIFNNEIKKRITSIPHIIVMLLLGYCVFKAYVWADINKYEHVLNQNDVSTLLDLSFLAFILLLGKPSSWRFSRNYYFSSAQKAMLWFNPMLLGMFAGFDPDTSIGIAFSAVVNALFVVYFYALYPPLYKIFVTAENDYQEFKQFTTS